MNKSVVEDTMWSFLSMGGQKGNSERLNEYAQDFIKMVKQKNGVLYAKQWRFALTNVFHFSKVLELFKETETKDE